MNNLKTPEPAAIFRRRHILQESNNRAHPEKRFFFDPLSTPCSLSPRGNPIKKDRYRIIIFCYHAMHSAANLKIKNYLQNLYNWYETVYKITKQGCKYSEVKRRAAFHEEIIFDDIGKKKAQWAVNYKEIVMREIQIKCFWAGWNTNRGYYFDAAWSTGKNHIDSLQYKMLDRQPSVLKSIICTIPSGCTIAAAFKTKWVHYRGKIIFLVETRSSIDYDSF